MKGVIEPCKNIKNQFISDIFLVPKPDKSYRLILNLKNLNNFIAVNHFKLEDGRTVTKLLNMGFYMATLDLQDAYYLISIHESCRKYLRFKYLDEMYEFTCLPFGLSVAPLVFYKDLEACCFSLASIRLAICCLFR